MIPRLFGLALAGFVAVGLAVADDDAKADKAIDGDWVVSKAERDGTADDKPVGDKVSFADGKMTIVPDEDPDRVQTAIIKLDSSKAPKQLDLTPERRQDPDDEPLIVKGIYKVEDGKLTILLTPPKGERPGDFKAAPGSRAFLIVLERPKK